MFAESEVKSGSLKPRTFCVAGVLTAAVHEGSSPLGSENIGTLKKVSVQV